MVAALHAGKFRHRHMAGDSHARSTGLV
jgi:hypothetical protein